jgi:hypothetical protein
MGELYLHNLQYYIDKFGCNTFIETGTGIGTGLSYAAKFPFRKLWSFEYHKELYSKCVERFKDNEKIILSNVGSCEGIANYKIFHSGPDDICLYWLDAHFPGADFHYNSYDHMKDNYDIHMPLKTELSLIHPANKDVIIIDDLQLYEKGNFELANPEFVEKYGKKDLSKVLELYQDTHNFERDYRHQGFLILTPK